jgi:hypothetical protein
VGLIQLGNTIPPNWFDCEPIALIYDPNTRITDKVGDLHPFGPNTEVHNAQGSYLNRIQRPHEVFVTAAILPNLNADQVQQFFEGHLHINPAVRFYYMIFDDGQQHDTDWPNIYAPKLVWCCSITDEFVWNLREVCAKANALNIEYCGQRARQFRRANQINSYRSYMEKKLRLARLQRIYSEELERSINLD